MIKGLLADFIVSIYLLGTLFLRFQIEDSMTSHPILSIALGLVMILLLWAMIKIKFLQPNYFGLLGDNPKNNTQPSDEDETTLFI